ncbi:hypothetical protein [Paraburkholderia terrae]|uniref:hypothetical protein n=1 Tax=Paraburkholderia terrae TaxID=311230 RepID=UPI001EE17B81|nr:hypothetical protein [Paraburkholderia terrae]GJH00241.1 hypothetical protein CBA19C8_06810 [Paraburkholderia terrae]
MGDMVDMYRDLKEIDKERRAENRVTGYKALVDAGFVFEVKNGGTHLIVQTDKGRVDYWPGTEKWMPKGERTRRGLDAFLEQFKPVGEPGAHAAPPLPVAQLAPVDDKIIQYAPHMSPFTVGVYARAGYTVQGAP